MPAQAGIQTKGLSSTDPNFLDSRFRGNDGIRKPVAVVCVVTKVEKVCARGSLLPILNCLNTLPSPAHPRYTPNLLRYREGSSATAGIVPRGELPDPASHDSARVRNTRTVRPNAGRAGPRDGTRTG